MKKILKQIQEEPFRLFFPLGILMALAGVGHWPFYALGWTSRYSAFFHSSIQTQAYLTCFVVGFLMTAMPRFASAASATGGEVVRFLVLILGNAAALSFGNWVLAELFFCGVLLSLLLFAAERITGRPNKAINPPLEFVWVPFAVIHGLTGATLLVMIQMKAFPAFYYQTAKLLSEQGFILCVVIGVGGFLAPRLMGTFQPYAKPGQMPNDPQLVKKRRGILLFHAAAGILFYASFWLNAFFPNTAYFLRAIIITAEYFWTCSFISFPRTPDFYAKLLWLSLWMVVIGSWGAACFPAWRTAMLHIIFIGGFSLMIFSVATMVVLSHGGENDQVRRPLPVLWIAAIAAFGSLVLRVAASFLPAHYFQLLGGAGFLWMSAGIFWFFFALPKTFRTMSREELERCHEEAKERVAQLRKTVPPPSSSGECCGHKNSCGH